MFEGYWDCHGAGPGSTEETCLSVCSEPPLDSAERQDGGRGGVGTVKPGGLPFMKEH